MRVKENTRIISNNRIIREWNTSINIEKVIDYIKKEKIENKLEVEYQLVGKETCTYAIYLFKNMTKIASLFPYGYCQNNKKLS